ncbi:MAG: hypothetical protein FJW30_13665 [Acidobacteria bacterium]|nr:hypothetical protein [Acidobacteriota bacterium]
MPYYEGDPPNDYFIPLLQAFQHDFPDIPFPEGSDLLQVLWCPRYCRQRNGMPSPVVRCVLRAGAQVEFPLSEFPQARMPIKGLVPESCNVQGVREAMTPFSDPRARLLGGYAGMHGEPVFLRCSACRTRLWPLLTVSGVDEEEQFFPLAPWLAQVQICWRCPGAPSRLLYETT